jgi:hypothetical protein
MSATQRPVGGHPRYARWTLAGFTLLLAPGVVAAAPITPLRIELTSASHPQAAGDPAVVTATITNAGTLPLDNVVLMLSLVDRSGTPAVPLGVEDWTASPAAGHVARLEPGHGLARTWPLRMVQSGRLAVLATAVVSGSGAVINSAPLTWDIAPVHNLRSQTVLPAVVGVPLLVVAGYSGLLWRRRNETKR